ncbi:MAG: hypothetical protein ABI921_03095 [Panacibacter sp.]
MDEFKNLNDDEKLKAENDFLKMKMMLEHGAEFPSADAGNSLPPEVENQFLRNILEFEKQFDQRKTTTVYDKLGQPKQFKPADEIDDDHIEEAWEELHSFMMQRGIELSVISPNIDERELYRFTIEELFEHEIDDINVPGITDGFIYDEFYPDYEYENTNIAIDDCIKLILTKEVVDLVHHVAKKITLNNHENLTPESYTTIINQFKNAFDDIELYSVEAESYTVEETVCTVKGNYVAQGIIDHDKVEWKDTWTVVFNFDDDLGYWQIVTVLIQNINF